MREEYTEEDINIDPKLINDTYQRLLKSGKLVFLEELKNMAINDHELESEASSISRAYEMMKTSIGTSASKIESMTLDDWRRHGLKRDVVERIGYLAHYYDTLSPKGRRKITKQFSSATKSSEDNYEDDFEDLDEDESINTLRNNFMDGSQNNSSIHTGSDYGSHNYRYDSKIEDEDLTVDSKVKTKAIAMTYSYDDEVYSDIEEYTEDSVKEKKSVPVSSSPPVKQQQQQKILRPTPSPPVEMSKRPQTMANVPIKPTTQVHRLQVEKLSEPRRVQTADSSNKNNSAASSSTDAARRHSASTSVSTARGRTATWITNGEWKLGEKIGSGSFGDVFQCLNHKGKLFAVKRMSMIDKSSEVDNLLQEIQLMRGFQHIHIVAYLGAWVDPDECFLYIFQEWVPGGSVAHMLKNFGAFPLAVVRQYTRQILSGLVYLHSNGIIHRDIKGGNILVDDSGTVKLADFGASTQLNHFNKTQETSTIKGTPYFMAPEVLANSRYGRKGDIWAVGCTMIQMLTGEPPWKDKNLKGLVQLHMLLTSWEGPPEYNVPVTPAARECLEMCFQKKEADRPTAQELLECEFLRDDDEMDESFALPSNHDPFEDSGILSGLKQDMNRAVTRSAQGLAKNKLDSGDTLAVIEQQIQERQARQAGGGRQKLPVNPFSNKASAANPFKSPPVTPANIDLPPSQFVTSPPGGKPSTPPTVSTMIDVHTPLRGDGQRPNTYSNAKPNSGGGGSGGLSSASNPNTPIGRSVKESQDIAIPVSQSIAGKSSNPFTRGNTSLKPAVAQSEQAQLHPSGAMSAREKPSGSSSRLHQLLNMSVDNQQQQQYHHPALAHHPSSSHHSSDVSNGAAHKYVNSVVKDSLTSIKKKAAESKSSRNTPREYNQSSNRDEELTPYNDNASDVDDVDEDYDADAYYNSGAQYDSKNESNKFYSGKYRKPSNYVMRREDSIDIIEEKVDVANYPSSGHRTHSAGTRSEGKSSAADDEEDSEPELLVCSPSKVPVHSSGLNLAGVTPTPNSAGPDSGRRGSNNSIPTVSSASAGIVNKPLSAKNRSKLPPAVDPQFSRLPSNPHMISEVTPRSARISSPSGPVTAAPLDDYRANSNSGDSADNWICLNCKSSNANVSNWCVVCAVRRGADGKKGVGSVVKRL